MEVCSPLPVRHLYFTALCHSSIKRHKILTPFEIVLGFVLDLPLNVLGFSNASFPGKSRVCRVDYI